MFKWKDVQEDAVHHANAKRAITSNFARTLKILQQKHLQCSGEEFIYSNDASNNLCNTLEAAFLHGLKDSVAHKLTAYVGLSMPPDQSSGLNFWAVAVKFTHSDVVTQLQNLSQINTDIGLCRAWVRLALNDGLMESYLHSMIVDTKTMQYFYHSHSFLRDHEQPGILKNYLTGLMSLEFKLSCNSSVLNSWSNTTLQLIGHLNSHNVPSPTISQAEGSRQGSSVPQNAGGLGDEHTVSPMYATSSQPADSSTFTTIQNIDHLQHLATAKSQYASYLSLSTSEGSTSSHVSCPDPEVGVANRAKPVETNSREGSVVCSRTNIDNLSERFSITPFPDNENEAKDQNSGTVTQRLTVLQSEGGLLDKSEGHQKSSWGSATTFAGAQVRKGIEGILKQILPSSFNPLITAGPESATKSETENQTSEDLPPSVCHKETDSHSNPAQEDNSLSEEREIMAIQEDENHSDAALCSIYHEIEDGERVFEEASVYKPHSDAEREPDLRDMGEDEDAEMKGSRVASEMLHSAGMKSTDVIKPEEPSLTAGQLQTCLPTTESVRHTHLQNHLPSSEPRTGEHTSEHNKSPLSFPEPEDSIVFLTDEQRHSAHSRKKFKDLGHAKNSSIAENPETNMHRQTDPRLNSHYPTHVSCDSAAAPDEDVAAAEDLNLGEQFQQDGNTNVAGITMSPNQFGNSLSSLSGWSSEIESRKDTRKQSGSRIQTTGGDSFASMLHTYTPASSHKPDAMTINQVIESLPCEKDEDIIHTSGSDSSPRLGGTSQWKDSGVEDFEVLKSPTEFFCGQVEANSSRMYFLSHVPRELGLSHQNFACKGCLKSIGLIYGPPRLCEFDGGLYCSGCHEDSEAYIPSSILFDWDFRKKKVCLDNYKFLQDLEDQPLYDIEELNPKLYNHVPELKDLKLLRQQLCYLRSYLFTCSQKVAESLRQKVWPREHLYDKRDLYSVTDFLQVQSGSLQKLIKDLVKFASQHVYECVLCSLKGFVCEICRNPQVIYPFELDTTMRCKSCKAVYHKTCMTESLPCPKCERWGYHMSGNHQTGHSPEDYGLSPQT